MHAALRVVPRESALFSSSCKPTSLGIVPYQVTAKVSAPQTPWCVPWFVAPQGISREIEGPKPLIFMRFHGVFLGSQHEIWSKQYNGKVREIVFASNGDNKKWRSSGLA